ncbi:MAG: DUF4058 family protein [Chloroflexi bacterium]|nr:DUF4058 family protein [Chloroflexota bacterium]
MPLRDHFRPPLDKKTSWEGFYGAWPAMIVVALDRKLPRRYAAGPGVRLGVSTEIDVGTFEEMATAVWAPPRPTLTLVTDFPAKTTYEVRVFDRERGSRLVAAVEIVSPANKDRPENRRAFVAKCAALLQEQVSVTIVDVVTTRHFNLYGELLELIGGTDPALAPEAPAVYAAACRGTKKDKTWLLETWMCPVALGQPLPTLPLWLADNFAVPLELEGSYEETCRILRLV